MATFFNSFSIFSNGLVSFSYAFLAGLIPALIWLWFWLHEDQHPEPVRLIISTFLVGMLGVIIVAPFERYMATLFPSGSLEVLFLWAVGEEVVKYLAAWTIALRTRAFDEPIDAFVYMTTAALGFSALENVFFTLTPILAGDPFRSLLTGDMRFIGASLLHIVTSGLVAIFIGLAYYKKSWIKSGAVIVGLVLAITLHTVFNFFIIVSNGSSTFIVFGLVWIAIIAIIFLLEKIKSIHAQKI
ncbi:MAG: PrsW family glutamic-type intramembrane protease [Candidatus Pacebacteria bacterium]|nr:PrsW family glutamic-type intramembrane protease [Candidatus Paceibacterota bacterium]